MKNLKTWDLAEELKTEEDIIGYLQAAFEDGDPALIPHALGAIARSKGMTDISKALGVGRESLYKSLSIDGNPSFATVMNVLKQLGLQLNVERAA